jgi:hypothetical protein
MDAHSGAASLRHHSGPDREHTPCVGARRRALWGRIKIRGGGCLLKRIPGNPRPNPRLFHSGRKIRHY